MSEHLVNKEKIATLPTVRVQHQFNDNAIRSTKTLSSAAGMQRLGIHLVTISRGNDSTTHHYHDADEEFIYIVSGRGIAHIGEESFEVGPGDFMGFPAPSEAHSLHNPNPEDLIYLMGGEGWPVDLVHYPEIRRSMTRSHGKRAYSDWDDITPVKGR